MAFINKTDLNNYIHIEILDGLTQGDDTIIPIIVDEAVSEMKGYLAARYNVESIFAETGNNRHPVIKMYCVDIVLYHLHSIHNPAKIPDIRVSRYERVTEWLKQVAKEMINPDLPKPENEPDKQYIEYNSNDKRDNHY